MLFSLIYVGHKNENIVGRETIRFLLIYVGHKKEYLVKKRDNDIFVDL